MTTITVSLAQISPKLGDVRANLEKHMAWIEESAAKSDLIVFPELSLCGYTLRDLVPEVALHPHDRDDPILKPIREASAIKGIDIVVGFVEEDVRHRFYIAAAYFHAGELLHIHRKVYLPTYGLFEEGRDLARGDRIRAFDTPWGRAGILICEDFWHASPPYILWLDGADLFIHHSASPGRGLTGKGKLDSSRFVEEVNQTYAALFTSYVLHCNRSGVEDGINFWGGSSVYGPNGEVLGQAPYFEEARLVVDLDLREVRRTRQRLPLLRDERVDLTLRELQRIMQERGKAVLLPSPVSCDEQHF